MKFWEEINEKYGTGYTQDDILVEDDNSFVTKDGTGWNRGKETFWRNRDLGDENDAKLTNPKPESIARFVSGLGLDEEDL